MSALSLEATAKAHGFTRIGINATMSKGAGRFLCEVWGDDFKFTCARGGTERAAITRAVKLAYAKRKAGAA